jgi:uncharacterized protein (DUF427 family)
MYRAVWNGTIIAESANIRRVEGNVYFPADSVRWEYLGESKSHTICPWKGRASYFHVVVDGEPCPDGAWTYRHPSPLARKIRDHVAFWGGIAVEQVSDEPGRTAGGWEAAPSPNQSPR